MRDALKIVKSSNTINRCQVLVKTCGKFSPLNLAAPDQQTPPHVLLQVIKLATEEGLVTPHTSAVGVLLQADPKDPSKTEQMEVSAR